MRRKLEVSGSIHTTKEKFKNAALFLRLGLLSTRRTSIRHENRRSFSKMLFKVEDLKMPAFRFSVDWKQFENGDVTIITWFLFSKVDNKQIQSNRWFLRFCISLARGVRACKPCKHWLTTFFNLKFCRNFTGPKTIALWKFQHVLWRLSSETSPSKSQQKIHMQLE